MVDCIFLNDEWTSHRFVGLRRGRWPCGFSRSSLFGSQQILQHFSSHGRTIGVIVLASPPRSGRCPSIFWRLRSSRGPIASDRGAVPSCGVPARMLLTNTPIRSTASDEPHWFSVMVMICRSLVSRIHCKIFMGLESAILNHPHSSKWVPLCWSSRSSAPCLRQSFGWKCWRGSWHQFPGFSGDVFPTLHLLDGCLYFQVMIASKGTGWTL